MIIATAGHVDHGKTTLLEALTGVNADRLPEEKKRGMTIDLGYAYWPQPDGRVVGFIDVPGHEKFLANMLAGVGGIDHALLVVACDDGVMAQTREHLAILKLAGKPALTVALTKADRVDEARVTQVHEEVRQLLAVQGWGDAALFVTAAAARRGIEALQAHLRQLSGRRHVEHHRFRLAIDRAFTVKGAGLVVTGTALAGQVKIGDSLWLTGVDTPVRVRGIHAQNQPAQAALAGQRVALNISGDADKERIRRGDWLLATPPELPAERVIVALEGETPLSQWQPVHLHHAARHVTGRVSLLADNLAELVLDTPLWLVDNDRLIVRDISARLTLAGARVVLVDSPRRGKRKPDYLAWLSSLSRTVDDKQTLALHLERGAVRLERFAWVRQLSEQAVRNLVEKMAGLEAGGMLISAAVAQRWKTTLLAALARYHEQHGDEPGPGRERLRRIALPGEPEPLVLALIEAMRQTGELHSRQGWLHLPGYEAGFSAAQRAVWEQTAALFNDEAWWVRDLAAQTGEEEQAMRQLLRLAAQQGFITAIVKDRYYRHDRIVQFADLIRELDREKGATGAADFRDRLNVGRKLAIQILEYFDRIGFTRRKGNVHVLRDERLFTGMK